MKIRVCVPSYRRPEVLTLRYLPFAAVYVDKSEEGVYRACNPRERRLSRVQRVYRVIYAVSGTT